MGKHKHIETPEEFWLLYEDYVNELRDNPRIQSVANYGKITEIPHERPQTLKGFQNFTRMQGKSSLHYFNNTDNAYNEYIEVCMQVKLSIEAEMLELALIGMIKEGMVSKILGINEPLKVEIAPGIKFEFDN